MTDGFHPWSECMCPLFFTTKDTFHAFRCFQNVQSSHQLIRMSVDFQTWGWLVLNQAKVKRLKAKAKPSVTNQLKNLHFLSVLGQ